MLEVRGKANSPAKTWVGELPTALAIGKPEEEQRLVLLKKGSYRAVYCHPDGQKPSVEGGATMGTRRNGCSCTGISLCPNCTSASP